MLAVLAAGGTAVLVKRYLDTQAANQARLAESDEEGPAIYVLVADETLSAGTSLTSGALRWQKWPDDAVESAFVSSTDRSDSIEKKFIGAVARRAIVAGTPVTEEMVFRREKAGFLAGAIEAGMRGVAVSVDATSGAAGFIQPGDRVDVVVTFDVREVMRGLGNPKATSEDEQSEDEGKAGDAGPAKYSTETVLSGVRVLAIDQAFNDVEGEPTVAKTVTLEATPKQVEMLAVARAMGRISLSLRSLSAEKAGASPPEEFTSDVEVSPTLRKVLSRLIAEEKRKKEEKEKAKLEEERRKEEAERRRLEDRARRARGPNRPPSVAAPPQPSGTTVRIYRGGKESTQEFPNR